MTITQLKYTLAVAEHGNFTTASEKCFVTQPTLSMQVQKLEEELGVTIFNRSTKPLQVTEVGEKVLNQARKIIEESLSKCSAEYKSRMEKMGGFCVSNCTKTQ